MKSFFKKEITLCLFVFFAIPSIVIADDIIIDNVTFVEGKDVNFDVILNNPSKMYTGFQCDIYLPEGLEYVSFSRNNDRLLSEHTSSFTYNSKGYYRLLVYSMPATPVAGTSGAVITVTVRVNDNLDTGFTSIDVKNKKFRDSDGDNNIYDDTTQNFDVVIEAKIGSSGYCSFSWPRDLDFSDYNNNIFIAKDQNTNNVIIQSVDDKLIPAGTGILIQGTPGEIVHPQTTTENVGQIDNNLFIGTSSAPFTVSSTGDAWALAVLGGKTGFYPCKEGVTVPQYKCYLPGGFSSKTFIMLKQVNSDDDLVSEDAGIVDGINTINDNASNDTYHDLQGRRVSTTRHGIYIRNNKKVIVK